MRLVVLALLLAAMLAGCSSGDAGGEVAGAGAASTAPPTVPPANVTALPDANPPRGTASILHLVVPPRLSTRAPVGNDTVMVPLGPLSPGQGVTFNRTVQASGNLSAAEAHIELRLGGTFVTGGGADPSCSVAVSLAVRRNGTVTGLASGCGSLGATVGAGDHAIDFGTAPPAPGTALRSGDELLVTVLVYLESPNMAQSWLALGSQAHDSWVQVPGLAEPVDAALA